MCTSIYRIVSNQVWSNIERTSLGYLQHQIEFDQIFSGDFQRTDQGMDQFTSKHIMEMANTISREFHGTFLHIALSTQILKLRLLFSLLLNLIMILILIYLILPHPQEQFLPFHLALIIILITTPQIMFIS